MVEATSAAGAAIEITVPHQHRPLEPVSTERVRRLRRHLIQTLRDLSAAKRPDRLIQPHLSAPDGDAAAVLLASCAACRGYCCLGGGEHAWLDERTLARVRHYRQELDARGLIRAYVQQVAPRSYAGSCLFHGPAGCTLHPIFRAELCSTFYCDGLKSFLRRLPDQPRAALPVIIRAVAPTAMEPAG